MGAEHRRSGSDTKAEIQEVALKLFTENGYESTTMREIAERLEITKPAVYYHFAGKEDIVRTIFDEHVATWDELIAWASDQPNTPELRREVLTRWAEATRRRGLRLIRFAVANQQALQSLTPVRDRLLTRLSDLVAIIIGPDAPIRDQLRARMAILSINLAVMTGRDLGADEADILDVALDVALELMPGTRTAP
jgi:AcrR family transcriptional regulator